MSAPASPSSLLKYSTGCDIAWMRCQNSDVSRCFASSEVEKCHDGIFQRTASRRRSTPGRRGTIYIVVIGVATTVSLIGLSGLMVARLQLRRVAEASSWTEAGDLALAGIELGIARINATSTWRSSFQNNLEITPISFGTGTLSFKLVDAALGIPGGDGDFNNNAYDPVRLHGIGRVGKTVRVYSVLLVGDVPMDALRTTVAASGYLDVLVPTVSKGGPLSTNGQYRRNATTTGNVEAASVTGGQAIYGTLTSPAAAKAMPDPTVFDAYLRLATPLAWPGGGTWSLTAPLLSSTVNPFSAATNPQGIYSVTVPAGSKLKINVNHIKGTFVVDCQNGASTEVKCATYWEPHSTELPILLIRHGGTGSVLDNITPLVGTITEGAAVYQSQLKGLVHVIGGAAYAQGPGNAVCLLGDSGPFLGTVIVDQDGTTNSNTAMFCWDPTLFLNPPVGYSTGPTVKIATGSLQWEACP